MLFCRITSHQLKVSIVSYCKECVIFVEESTNAGLVNPFVVPLPEVDLSVLPFLLLCVVYIGSV